MHHNHSSTGVGVVVEIVDKNRQVLSPVPSPSILSSSSSSSSRTDTTNKSIKSKSSSSSSRRTTGVSSRFVRHRRRFHNNCSVVLPTRIVFLSNNPVSLLQLSLFLLVVVVVAVLVLILPSADSSVAIVEAYSNNSEYNHPRKNIYNNNNNNHNDNDNDNNHNSGGVNHHPHLQQQQQQQEKTCRRNDEGDQQQQQQQEQQQQQAMKAWTCHGKNQRDLVERLRQAGIVKTSAVRQVMELVDRGNYITVDEYMDAPQPIGLGQTVSAPHMHAHALEEIYPSLASKLSKDRHHRQQQPTLKILDVGCGSGYLTAAFGRWVHPRPGSSDDEEEQHAGKNILGAGPGSHVYGIDVRSQLVDTARQNILKDDSDLFSDGIVDVRVGDGWKGLPEESPFDAIHVGACAESIPYQLVDQLDVGGVMIIPIGPQHGAQVLYKIERVQKTETTTSDNKQETEEESGARSTSKGRTSDMATDFHPDDFKLTKLLGVRYVPLVQVSEPS